MSRRDSVGILAFDRANRPRMNRRHDLHGKLLGRFRVPLEFSGKAENESLEFLPIHAGFQNRAHKPGQGIRLGRYVVGQTLVSGAESCCLHINALQSRFWRDAQPFATLEPL